MNSQSSEVHEFGNDNKKKRLLDYIRRFWLLQQHTRLDSYLSLKLWLLYVGFAGMVISPRILVKHEMSPRQKKKSLVTLYLANMFTKTAEQVGTGGGLAPHFFQNR